ncbi:Nucleoid occlusion protein [compost metagenome]
MARRQPDLTADDFDLGKSAVNTPAPAVSGLGHLESMLQRPTAETPAANEPGVTGYQAFKPGTHYPVGSFVRFPLDQVVENPRNPRVYFNDEDMKSLQLSLSTAGQQEPAKVFLDPRSGKYMLKSGHRRHRGLTALGKETINAEVVEHKSPLDEFREARELNSEAKAQSHLDDAIRFSELLQEYGLDHKTLAQKLHISEPEVSKRIKIGTLPREVLDRLSARPGALGLDACYLLAQIYERRGADSLEFVLKLVTRALEDKLTVAQLREAAADAKSADSPTAIPAGKRQQPLKRAHLKGGEALGEVKAFESRIEVRLEKMPPGVRDELFEKMLQVFREAGLLGEK